jgi:hypothetical protein
MGDESIPDPRSPSVGPSRSDRLLEGGAFAAVLLAAAWPRLAGLRQVFARGELMQWDGDSAYHLKRILYALAHFPGLPRFDPDMNWPDGGYCHWPDGFDLLAAAWGLVAGQGSLERATMAVLGFSTIIGLLALWAAMDLARLVIPEGPAKSGGVIAAGILTAFVPSFVYQSQVGFLDHHVAELLSFLLLAGWALRRVRRPDAPSTVGVAWEIGGALAATFSVWVYSGGVLYVAIAFAIVTVALLRDDRPTLVGSGLPAFAGAALAVTLLSLPSLLAHGRTLSYVFPSLLQPLLIGGAAMALGLAWTTTRVVRGFGRRVLLLAALGIAAGLAASIVLPRGADEFRAGLLGWFFRRDPWIASIAEFQPFGWNQPSFLMALFVTAGTVGVAAPLLLLAGGWAVVRGAGARGIAFVFLSAGFVLLTLNQVRFERIGQPLLMINVAAALAAAAHWRGSVSGKAMLRLFPVAAAAVLILSDPTLRGAISPDWLRLPPAASAGVALRDLARGGAPSGVLTSWGQGHLVGFTSGLPTPTNGFGSYLDAASFREAESVLTSDGATLDAYLGRKRIRFVLAGALTGELISVGGLGPFESASGAAASVLNLAYMKSYGLSPLVIGGSAIPGAGVRHLERLMPVFGTIEQPAGLAFSIPALWIYERVAGAQVVGKAPPGSRVIASLDFREQGRPHVWRAFADAGPRGDFELILPFPTSVIRPGLSSGPRYALRVDDGPSVEVAVPEGIVRSGETVRAGVIRAGTR